MQPKPRKLTNTIQVHVTDSLTSVVHSDPSNAFIGGSGCETSPRTLSSKSKVCTGSKILPMHVNWPTIVFAYIIDTETQHEVHVFSEVWRVVCTLN